MNLIEIKMNFIDYCLYTRNYSALNAIDQYTKTFGEKTEKYKKGDHVKINGEEHVVVGAKEADENFGTLVKNKLKRLGAGLLVAVPVGLLAWAAGMDGDRAAMMGSTFLH